MTTTFVQAGDAIDYTSDADMAAGSVVVEGDLVGVTKKDIKANELGALAVCGVFDFPKAKGNGTAIPFGTKVFWDVADEQAKADDEEGGNKLIGKTVADASDDDELVRVRLNQ